MKKSIYLIGIVLITWACGTNQSTEESSSDSDAVSSVSDTPGVIVVEAENLLNASDFTIEDGIVSVSSESALEFNVDIPTAGRYKTEVVASSEGENTLWVEDYTKNTDGRTYNISGSLDIPAGAAMASYSVDGTPLNAVTHPMKLHVADGGAKIDKLIFTLIREHEVTPETLTQNTDGDTWEVAWSDEFDGTEVDQSKWTYDVGNWGWGNNELQYYTVDRPENARVEDGNLIIEARKNDMEQEWTSARLTTRGKVSFLYGKIEFRAQVPSGKGNWAAAWTLGDSYVDELSWPYCGEIDIMESVGYEVDPETLDGIAHCTVHTPAYYFKINNQISSVKDIPNIAGEFHTYTVEWTPTEVKGFVDGEEYYLYDKTANDKEWPFNQPQNIIINLAMGGGWGGAQGMDPDITSQKIIFDYIRVYAKN